MVRAAAMNGVGTRERASVIAVLSAMALVVLDAGLVNVALPTIADSLKVTPASAILAVSAYQTALLIGLLPCAHVAERLGYRRLFVGGLVLFSAASMLCAVAPSLPLLVAARVLQGLGGAAIMALGIALLRFALGADRLGAAIGWNALTVALCSGAGPILGAVILAVAPWPWLFLAKLPISAIALVAARALPDEAPTRQPVDAVSLSLHASVAALILIAAELAIPRPLLAVPLTGGAMAFAVLLIRRGRGRQAPVWPVDLLARRPFRVAVAASVCCFTAQSAGLLALPFYLQLGLGQSPLATGLVMTCWPLAVAMTSPLANRLAQRVGSARLCVAGGAVLGAGLLLSALWPAAGDLAPLAIGAALSGLGFGLFQVPNNRTMFLTAPPERSAAAGGLQGSARLLGQTFGALIAGLLFACAPALAAPRLSLALGSLFAVAAALVSALEVRTASHSRCRRASALGNVP
jgi:DHA2 family multidrug resistance protein-like MFS transporter